MTPIKCEVQKSLNFSHRWTVDQKFTGLIPDHVNGFGLIIPYEDSCVDGSYRTVFGPYFSHSAKIYAKSNHNISAALTRLTCDPEASDEIGHNQLNLLSKQPRAIRRLRDALSKHIALCHDQQHHDWYEALLLYADIPHPKRSLRLQAAIQIIDENLFNVMSKFKRWRIIRKVDAKFKKMEWAKPGKFPRLIADLSVPGSLLAGFAFDRLKTYLASFSYRNCVYVKAATKDALRETFGALLNPDPFAFRYFSDDSCLAFVDSKGERRMYNMDISCCDGSHTRAIYQYIESCIPVPQLRTLIAGAHDQLRLDLNVLDSSGKLVSRLVHAQGTPYSMSLYSGSTATTMTNNMANLIMGVMLSESIRRGRDTEDDIIKTARLCGYKVTLQPCSAPQKLQFLKHSPNSAGDPWLNFGVILRTLGVAKYDVPGRGPLRRRAERFQSALVQGFKHAGDSELMSLLTEKHPKVEGFVAFDNWMLEQTHNQIGDNTVVTREDIAARYGTEDWQYDQVLSLYRGAQFGDCIRCDFADIVFALDYGYEKP